MMPEERLLHTRRQHISFVSLNADRLSDVEEDEGRDVMMRTMENQTT
jgi:hypothetical protein